MEEDTFYRVPTKKEVEKLENAKPGDAVSFEDTDAPHFEPRWLAPDETPFEARLFDTREYALHMISNTADKNILGKYIQMQSSDGKEYVTNNFKDGIRIKCNLDFPFPETDLPEGILFRSEMMEEKWNIYKYEGQIYIVRSWTGELKYVTDYEKTEDGFLIKEIAMDKEVFKEDMISFYVNEVHFLLISHVMGYLIPHPLPYDLEDDPDSILKFSFSEFGNRGYFGYFSPK
ncbi:MAG: hypothetical protein APG12_00139 [Candidatus Methanofastidiosum methylothiophilum]|uniref:Uncharacterized protein n=1 Tax=Candidatus Methanofastidiosum methylothiophilum TaxID=1705564 RepID=A0A150IQN3_9EURY|nr:MAG: hypothetical protein APG10_00819 [Candidatus Methanofastidiosum methylthiophilus]KYC47182.1 MAG: hypothetical protein APG11_01338 [Candidatus Methanofastidiosum methylthiophilus]KYC51475.1 MAG: hypothetical protein APG12_00139 [Candidatus Methanofastidiosum methylthiophilus]